MILNQPVCLWVDDAHQNQKCKDCYHLKKREEGSMPASMYCRSKVYYHSQSDIAEKDPGLSETICHKEEKAGAAGDQGNYSFPFKTMDSISIFPFS